MKVFHAILAAVVVSAAAAVGPVQASDYGTQRPHRRQPLPPLSGTIHVPPGAFGGGHSIRHAHVRRPWYASRYAPRYRRYGPDYGFQGEAYAQLRRGGYDSARGTVYWNRNVEFYGEGNDTLAMTVTAGTADSAPTRGSYRRPSVRHHAEIPVQFVYGEPDLWYGGPGRSEGYAPTGGLGYYNSGSPGRMAYYSSSSSAGPRGTPGGLGIYSSGSYGPGPKILHLGGQQDTGWRGGLRSGPHIIHVGHDG